MIWNRLGSMFDAVFLGVGVVGVALHQAEMNGGFRDLRISDACTTGGRQTPHSRIRQV